MFSHPSTAPSPLRSIANHRASKVSPYVNATTSRQNTLDHRSFKLGNLLLSSCPGKKVRLSGPVRGRGTVYRDLDVDIRRMKNLGAQCVVCCLDDEELEFLGISWTEYCRAAHQEGLDVLRIPLPEGLAPLSPESLDADLHRIIERYTLQGISVLVHCRGGVGRAGLFACCWMLKLGLCGWIETDVGPRPAGASTEPEVKDGDTPEKMFQWDSNTVVRRDTLQLVERAIGVVRRRRSVKAIETLEQVQFLVEYVDYLRAYGRVGDMSGSARKCDMS
ncbi:phosphatases II [Gyrodon lividus]|nr:phosphatases II [Gyrodon lividus]